MCKYCESTIGVNETINRNVIEINGQPVFDTIIEMYNTMNEDPELHAYLSVSTWANGSLIHSIDTSINYCPICGRKLVKNE